MVFSFLFSTFAAEKNKTEQKKNMPEPEKYLYQIAETEHVQANVSANYLDEDIIIIDNVKLLTEPSAVRLQMNMIVFCNKGRVQMELNGRQLLFGAQQLMLCSPNTTFDNLLISPDFDFKAVFISNRMMISFLREKMNIWTDTLYVRKEHVFDLDKDSQMLLNHFYELIHMGMSTHLQNPYRVEALQSFLRGALLSLCGILSLQQQDEPPHKHYEMAERTNRSGKGTPVYLFQQFLAMLNNEPKKHQVVEYYANKLCITPKYLSAVCKQQSGKTASDWITEHVIEDIRYYLKSTDLSIKQICNRLGFSNSSFFGKYVKEHFGMTPLQVREL